MTIGRWADDKASLWFPPAHPSALNVKKELNRCFMCIYFNLSQPFLIRSSWVVILLASLYSWRNWGLKRLDHLFTQVYVTVCSRAGVRAQLSLIAKTTPFCRLCGSLHTKDLISLIPLIFPLNITHCYYIEVLGFVCFLLSSLALLILPHKSVSVKTSGCSPLCLHICTYISTSIIFVYLYINISRFIHPSIHPTINFLYLIYRSIHPTIYPPIFSSFPSICLSVSMSIHSFIHPFSLSYLFNLSRVSWPFCLTQNHIALKLQSQIQKMTAVLTLALASHTFWVMNLLPTGLIR